MQFEVIWKLYCACSKKIYFVVQTCMSALAWSSLSGHLQVVQLLIEKGANVNLNTEVCLMTPLLMDCIVFYQVYVIHMLFPCIQDGWSALMLAAKDGHLQVVQYLIEKGADVTLNNEVSLMMTMLLLDYIFFNRVHVNISFPCI